MERGMPFHVEHGGERDHPLHFGRIRLTKRCIFGAPLLQGRVTDKFSDWGNFCCLRV
jgi:hypothetical protein